MNKVLTDLEREALIREALHDLAKACWAHVAMKPGAMRVYSAGSSYEAEQPGIGLARACVAYDDAIRSCANSPERMSSFCTTEGDDLDTLYSNFTEQARALLATIGSKS